MKNLLRLAGKNGALVVIAGVLIGLAIPQIADLARPYLIFAIFVFTFGSFLKFDAGSMGKEMLDVRRNIFIVMWATFGVPATVFLMILVFKPGAELTQGLLFWSLVPASPACVAFAAILGLNPTIALLSTIFGTIAAPFYIPALAAVLGNYHLDIDPITTSFELVVLVGGAFLTSTAVKRFSGGFVRENPEVITGIAVLALFLGGMGSMKGIQAQFITNPVLSLQFVALAYVLLFGFEILGALMFWQYGRDAALTAGLVSGTRTITLAWVILGSRILPSADLFLATGMIAKYTAPGVTKYLLARLWRQPEEKAVPALVPVAEA